MADSGISFGGSIPLARAAAAHLLWAYICRFLSTTNKMYPLEVSCMEPDNYKKIFRALYWSGVRKIDKKHRNKIGKKEKVKRIKTSRASVYDAPTLLGNPSQFAVYAAVRRAVLTQSRYLHCNSSEQSDDSDTDDTSTHTPVLKLAKVTGIGLRAVFALISQARHTEEAFCESALRALLDVLQGYAPEELHQEPSEIILNIHAMLVDIARGSGSDPKTDKSANLTSLSCTCLMALCIARGEAELVLDTVASLILAPSYLTNDLIQIPFNCNSLQRSVQSVILGSPARNLWLNHGVPLQALVNSFPIDLPSGIVTKQNDFIVRSIASDGFYLYIYSSKGLLKIGTGYGNSIKQHVYQYISDFFNTDRHGWIGYCQDRLFVRLGRKKSELYQIDIDTLQKKTIVKLDPISQPSTDGKSAIFSDGNQLGVISLTNNECLTIRMYDVNPFESDDPLPMRKEYNVHLLRRRTLALGRAPYDDGAGRRTMDLDTPYGVQVEDSEEDPLISIAAGQDFGLLLTESGKVYYNGKGSSLGYKMLNPNYGRWTLMKDTTVLKSESQSGKRSKVIQVAVGHEGAHAVLVLDNGTSLFAGIARRGEDADINKYRKLPKYSRPKKMTKADGHFIVYAACNYGTSALVTREGTLLVFGKDTLHCNPFGVVTGLKNEKVVQVALGKAHAVTLTDKGEVFTFGINNRGQCGREFGYTRERAQSSKRQNLVAKDDNPQLCLYTEHNWIAEYCRVCTICRECTGFSTGCQCSARPNRMPREKCGCGEGDSGCSTCGVCRRCAEVAEARRIEAIQVAEPNAQVSAEPDKEVAGASHGAPKCEIGPEIERDTSVKVSCLPPARVSIPGGHRITAISCGIHHTVLLTDEGDVLTFGSNQFGQLGAGDIAAHHRMVRVRVPKAAAVAAGSNHTAVLTKDGELYTFGSYQNGSLGRPRFDEQTSSRTERSPIWYATPTRVPRLGHRNACKAIWLSASGDQTFVQVSLALIKAETLFTSTITANGNTIIILPNRSEHTFKCITISKTDGTCNAWTGPEQADFINSVTCLDPLYDVLWCYQPQLKVIKCYNILAFDSYKHKRCSTDEPEINIDGDHYEYPNHGSMRRIEDFKNIESLEALCNANDKKIDNPALTHMSILNYELAIPSVPGRSITRMHAALHLLGCLDSLTYAHDNNLNQADPRRDGSHSSSKDDYLNVNRFEGYGGGWGYSGHSIEAIRFMCDTDILLGGYGLFGGRGDYTVRIKLYDIGTEGGEQEGDGELIAESEEIIFECGPREKFPAYFETPHPIFANRWYVAWACVSGPSSDCGSAGQPVVINDEISFHFKTSKRANNGTDVNAGQIPCLLYSTVSGENIMFSRNIDHGEPIVTLSNSISRKITVSCFKSLITLLEWSWNSFKSTQLQTNGQMAINFQKLMTIKYHRRLIYVMRACLRISKSYINEIFPQNNKKRNSVEYMSYFEAIADIRHLIHIILSDAIPTCALLSKKYGKGKIYRVCYMQFPLEMTNYIITECHDTLRTCFHAFFPTATLKWKQICSLLVNVRDGVVPWDQTRELIATCAAMCSSQCLKDVLKYIIPITEKARKANFIRKDIKVITNETPNKSATVPRSSSSQKPPPVPPRLHSRDGQQKCPGQSEPSSSYADWNLFDLILTMLDIVMCPIKKQMMTRQCSQTHDHGEIKENEKLSQNCCKLLARIVAELCLSTTTVSENDDLGTNKFLITPSRYMRVNPARLWTSGNGSPDAIIFTVDRPGILLAGVGVYGGLGKFDYQLELLHDVRQQFTSGEDTVMAHCWISIEVTQGSFTSSDCYNETVQLKFDRPVLLKEDVRYAVRLSNKGGRTISGDCGLPSVKGPDGTTFRFTSCSFSFNGTNITRGQIPSLIYVGTSKSSSLADPIDSMATSLRNITLTVASLIMGRCADLFSNLRNELTAEDLKRNAAVLQNSPAILTLVPYTLANLEILNDSKSVVHLLEIIHKMLPQVTAMNLLIPSGDESTSNVALPPVTGHGYTWVESDHPYKEATVKNTRVLFPLNITWILLEMDPRSIMSQPEDTLTVFAVAGEPRSQCYCTNDNRTVKPVIQEKFVHLANEAGDIGDADISDETKDDICLNYNCTYVAVTPKLSNIASEWPKKAILVPGNEVIFSLETASDYLKEYNKPESNENRYGFRCLCVGYEDLSHTTLKQGLSALEMELAYAGAASAARLLTPDLDIPPLDPSTIREVQNSALGSSGPIMVEVAELYQDPSEAVLLSRGLELSSPPTIHQVLDGLPLLRSVSTERQFVMDFVSGVESTAGGRLASWLSPAPRVDPSQCELVSPTISARPGTKLLLPVIVKDQYGDSVVSPNLRVEIVVQRLEEGGIIRTGEPKIDNQVILNIPDASFDPIIKDQTRYQSITAMQEYEKFSFEELRLSSGLWGDTMNRYLENAGRIPVERLCVKAMRDGTYISSWTPRAPGTYSLRCTMDDQPSSSELVLEVAEGGVENSLAADRAIQTCNSGGSNSPVPPAKLRKFAPKYTAGLRVRSSPSLQAEEIGVVPKGGHVAFLEEVVNKDGTWVRLSTESIRSYTEGGTSIAWCLQYHSHFDRALLIPLKETVYTDSWTEFGEAQERAHLLSLDDDNEEEGNDPNNEDENLGYLFAQPPEPINENVAGASPFAFGPEPSKRNRFMKEDPVGPAKLVQWKSNGNVGADKWWTPDKLPTDLPVVQEQNKEDSNSAQAGTQTSPDSESPSTNAQRTEELASCSQDQNDDNRSSLSTQPGASSAPPIPSSIAEAPPPPSMKYAMSPTQAECMRALFAAVLWHEGIVHDAIACAAFLKFHPQLTKDGALVVTRSSTHVVHLQRPQRHSVEVSSTGQYLNIQPSMVETLTRSGMEASASRARRNVYDISAPPPPISEEYNLHGHSSGASSAERCNVVVTVLPPAMRALVALWDTIANSDQLAVSVDKLRLQQEWNLRDISLKRPSSSRKRKESTTTPYSVYCELCRTTVVPPISTHMRHTHIGCRTITIQGYDRAGGYKHANALPGHTTSTSSVTCGNPAQSAIQSYQLWYMFCENCREKALKALPPKTPKLKTVSDEDSHQAEEPIVAPIDVDHQMIKDNAIFLLDLAPVTNSESMRGTPWQDDSANGGFTPPSSVWQPAPPFQCLTAFGVAPPKASLPVNDNANKFHSLGRPQPPAAFAAGSPYGMQDRAIPSTSKGIGFHRSVSMGQADSRNLANAALPDYDAPGTSSQADSQDAFSGTSSLLTQPSTALRQLITCGEWNPVEGVSTVSAFEAPKLDTDIFMNRPVINFVLTNRDLLSYRQKMDAAIRMNTIRQFAYEALNWLLRSVTQPTCVHDVMWWFCTAVDKYTQLSPVLFSSNDNSQNAPVVETPKKVVKTASAAALCPGGRSGRAARAALHGFLGSVSALAPSLPPGGPAALQAVRCWALNYSPYDRTFLHRSQVFNVISKNLSHAEEESYEDNANQSNEKSYLWSCPDLTGWCDIIVSSRQGMTGALTDGSTETFWESGDEDRGRAKWVQVSYSGGPEDSKPHVLCLHIDNTRDTANKTLVISFLCSGGASELFHMQDIEVDTKIAAWICYTLPRVTSSHLRIRCELRGPDPAVRVRQVSLLGLPTRSVPSEPSANATQIMQSLVESETLRVFRLVTSQVFGKLLDYESEILRPEKASVDDVVLDGDDSDLREHVVGILFAGHKLSSLQTQVMAHIVAAIGAEAARARDDWEARLANADATEKSKEVESPRTFKPFINQDNYCFEMLSLLLALSGSAVGRAHLAQKSELLIDLLALLHTGSERVQRQVISLLRRMIAEIPPKNMMVALNWAKDPTKRVSILDHLVSYLSKAIVLQIKVKGSGSSTPRTAVTGTSLIPIEPEHWFMKGHTINKHGHLVAKLLSDMAEGKVSEAWQTETRSGLINYVVRLTTIIECDRKLEQCITSPAMWFAVAALCVCEELNLDLINLGGASDGTSEGTVEGARNRNSCGGSHPFCSNHDDGQTLAVIDCGSCGTLCVECDRILHLKKVSKTHHRQICKEEETAVRIDIHEGCGRAKLFWLLLLVDRRSLKGLAEFRGISTSIDSALSSDTNGPPLALPGPPGLFGTCRFCGARSNAGLLAIGNICADQQCQDHGKMACARVLSCNHLCGGVREEPTCLPCLYGCTPAANALPLRQDADDMCMICFTDPLQAAPAIQLTCGHVFHLHCCKKVLNSKWNGPRITFSFSQCPICKDDMVHWTLEELLEPIRNLFHEVRRKALLRLQYEGNAGSVPFSVGPSGAIQDPAIVAMEKYAYYVCHKCKKAYFGGLARCEAEMGGFWEPSELVCGACSDVTGARICAKHGSDFLEYKCRYCCSVAVFFCFGTSHFCNACHDDFQRVTSVPRHMLPQCPAGPKCEQLPGTSDECPLHTQHPETGEEFALGCGICRNAQAF